MGINHSPIPRTYSIAIPLFCLCGRDPTLCRLQFYPSPRFYGSTLILQIHPRGCPGGVRKLENVHDDTRRCCFRVRNRLRGYRYSTGPCVPNLADAARASRVTGEYRKILVSEQNHQDNAHLQARGSQLAAHMRQPEPLMIPTIHVLSHVCVEAIARNSVIGHSPCFSYFSPGA